jgi:hypothetical protein
MRMTGNPVQTSLLLAPAARSALGLGCVKTIVRVVGRKIDSRKMRRAFESFAKTALLILLLCAVDGFQGFHTARAISGHLAHPL